MLPSKKDVFGRLFYLLQGENKSVKQSASVVANELIKIYNSFEIPTKRKDGIEKKIFKNYNEYGTIRKSKNNAREGIAIKEKQFTDSLDVLFDVSHLNVIQTLRSQSKLQAIEFLNEHRESMATVRTRLSLSSAGVAVAANVSSVDSEMPSCNPAVELDRVFDDIYSESEKGSYIDTETDTDASVCQPPKKVFRQRVVAPIHNLVNADVTQSLDRFQISNIGAAIIMGQIAYNLGHDVRSLHISAEHIRMQRIKHRETIFKNIKNQFSANAAFTVHWDGKILEDCTSVDNLKCNRLAIILSSCGESKVLGIPKVVRGTGKDEAAAIYSALMDWCVPNNIMAMCFDTTASNTSTSIGACAILEQKLNRQLLHLACRHHVMELLAGAAFKATVEPTTSAPKILLFERFRTSWPDLHHESFELGTADPDVAKCFPEDIRNGLVSFIKDQIQNKIDSTRHDYMEMLNLSLLFLGEQIPGFKISQPGAISRARWMAKIIYSLKIFLFRKQFTISTELFKNIRRFTVFVVRIYLKYWFLCQLAPKAPANDLRLLQELEDYKTVDKVIGNVVQKKLRAHLWYLNECNVALAFFDDGIDVEMKKKMALNLSKDGHPDKPQRINLPVEEVMSAEICDFVTENTYFFFDTILNEDITGISKSFLMEDPSTWEENYNYISAKRIVKNLLVVNDIAERGIALITRFNAVLTHQEKQKQFILHTMEQYYKDLPLKNFSKYKFIEYLNKTYPKQTIAN